MKTVSKPLSSQDSAPNSVRRERGVSALQHVYEGIRQDIISLIAGIDTDALTGATASDHPTVFLEHPNDDALDHQFAYLRLFTHLLSLSTNFLASLHQ